VREQEFLTDGSYTTAFAARPLAAAGIVVLQMAGRRENEVTAREASDNVTALESAVRHLNRQGLIDPSRVGVIGFSRTAYYVESTLVARPNLFAAATIADGVDYSYLQYLMFSENIQTESETIYGSPPFAEGLRGWMSASPGFRLNNVRTPLRIEAITPASVLAEWEIYASLRLQGKPVDLIYFPNGQHILQAPLERLASQGGNVDWFRFWLQDYEDPDPAKAEQYVRWRQMRDKAAAHRASAHDASIAAESPIK
jgi:dipeptidyl aminopeptidase/acylaminoacyl peptidase